MTEKRLVAMRQDLSESGELRFQIDIPVMAEQMRAWPVDRITAFFEGLAMVVAAANPRGLPGDD